MEPQGGPMAYIPTVCLTLITPPRPTPLKAGSVTFILQMKKMAQEMTPLDPVPKVWPRELQK